MYSTHPWPLATLFAGWYSFTGRIDGLEEIVGVNHFGHYLLTTLLLPSLKRSKAGRIVIVSSSLHDLDAQKKGDDTSEPKSLLPNFPKKILFREANNFDGAFAYRVSKLCNIWFKYCIIIF